MFESIMYSFVYCKDKKKYLCDFLCYICKNGFNFSDVRFMALYCDETNQMCTIRHRAVTPKLTIPQFTGVYSIKVLTSEKEGKTVSECRHAVIQYKYCLYIYIQS